MFGFVKGDRLFAPLGQISHEAVVDYALVDSKGEVLLTWRNQIPTDLSLIRNNRFDLLSPFYLVSTDFPHDHLKMYCVLETKVILRGNQILFIYLTVFFILSLGFLLYMVRFFRRDIIRPLRILTAQSAQFRNGNFSHEMPITTHNKEFAKIQKAYSDIIEELVAFRTSEYERQLKYRDMERKYVRMQVNPHFFLNSLSTIHTMGQNGNNEEICTFVESLCDVMRYILKSGIYTVPLQEELIHLNQYIQMQSLLYKNSLLEYFDIDEDAKDWPVPQMCLHTLIENIYKHTIVRDRTVLLNVRASRECYAGEEHLHVFVQDTGVGFPTELLKKIANPNDLGSRDGGVGLLNICELFALLYGRNDLVYFYNAVPNGACIEMWIPGKTIVENLILRNDQP